MIKKRTNPAGKSVRVTFELPGEKVNEEAAVAGSFNDWDPEAGEMTYVKSRDVWKVGVTFEKGARHEFRYLIDGETWENDDEADDYSAAEEYFIDNSVVEV